MSKTFLFFFLLAYASRFVWSADVSTNSTNSNNNSANSTNSTSNTNCTLSISGTEVAWRDGDATHSILSLISLLPYIIIRIMEYREFRFLLTTILNNLMNTMIRSVIGDIIDYGNCAKSNMDISVSSMLSFFINLLKQL